jgi:hypothetical protein
MRHHLAPQEPVGQVPAKGPVGNLRGVEGCKKAVLRRSEPSASRAVTGGAGSTQSTEKPARPNRAAAVSPATPPPEIRISTVSRVICVPFARA